MKISKREAGIIAVVIIALSGISFVFAGKAGVPFDELWNAIFGVEERVEDLEETVELIYFIQRIDDLETRIEELEEGGVEGPPGPPGPAGLGKPAYDSGWDYIKPDESITLNTGDIEFELNAFVYVLGMTSNNVIHQLSLGGEYDGGIKVGLTWSMTKGDTIELRRLPEDVNWDKVRVMVWGLPEPPK